MSTLHPPPIINRGQVVSTPTQAHPHHPFVAAPSRQSIGVGSCTSQPGQSEQSAAAARSMFLDPLAWKKGRFRRASACGTTRGPAGATPSGEDVASKRKRFSRGAVRHEGKDVLARRITRTCEPVARRLRTIRRTERNRRPLVAFEPDQPPEEGHAAVKGREGDDVWIPICAYD